MSSPYLNTYVPPPPPAPLAHLPHLETPIESYDLDFNSPVPHPHLRTDKVALIPFIPSLHARQLDREMGGKREVMRLMPYPKNMGGGLQEILEGVEGSMRSLSDRLLFAIFDLTKASTCKLEDEAPGRTHKLPPDHPPVGCMAGIIAIFCDRVNLTGELGHIIVFPKAQRTHVLSHAAGLLMHYALDFPCISTYDPVSKTFVPPGSSDSTATRQKALGLRRLQWQAHVTNATSIKSAGRLGFEKEGVVRMHGTATGGDQPGREGDGAPMSRSNWVGSITWKDWEERVKDVVDGLVAR